MATTKKLFMYEGPVHGEYGRLGTETIYRYASTSKAARSCIIRALKKKYGTNINIDCSYLKEIDRTNEKKEDL